MDHNDERESADCNSGNTALVRPVAVGGLVGTGRDQHLYAKRDRVPRVSQLESEARWICPGTNPLRLYISINMMLNAHVVLICGSLARTFGNMNSSWIKALEL
jgi:hypothetical protein